MNLRFAGMITGCMLVGASAAAYHRADSRPAPSRATLAAATPDAAAPALPSPLFLQAATEAPTSAAWPPVTSVAFYGEMFEQLPVATTPVAEAEISPAAPQVVAALPSAPQTRPAPSGSVGIPRPAPVRGPNAVAVASGQQTPAPVQVASADGPQTPSARRLNTRPGQGQTPPAGNAVLASSDEPADDTETTPDAGQTPPDRNAGNGGQPPRRPGATRPRENADMIEVVIRDQFGRPIRVERVDRRLLKGGPAYPPPPPPYRFYHSYPHGPHGGPAPYGRHGSYGPYGLYR